MRAAEKFNKGFANVEFTASALVDMAFHELGSRSRRLTVDPMAFQAEILAGSRYARRASSCGMRRRISRTCSPGTAIRPDIIPTCGPAFSMPMRSRRSRKPAKSRSIGATARQAAAPHLFLGRVDGSRSDAYVAFRGKLPVAGRPAREGRAGVAVRREILKTLKEEVHLPQEFEQICFAPSNWAFHPRQPISLDATKNKENRATSVNCPLTKVVVYT